ncbi:MAG: hypothetical protein C4345_00400 [Chloroflexota bacterium]
MTENKRLLAAHSSAFANGMTGAALGMTGKVGVLVGQGDDSRVIPSAPRLDRARKRSAPFFCHPERSEGSLFVNAQASAISRQDSVHLPPFTS